MIAVPEQVAAVNKAAVEAAVSYSNIVFEGAEKLLDLNIKVAKSVLADSAKNAKALAGVKDVQELAALQQAIAQPAVEKAVAYSKAVYEVAAETQADLQKFVEVTSGRSEQNRRRAGGQAREVCPGRFRGGSGCCQVGYGRCQQRVRHRLQSCQAGGRPDRGERRCRDRTGRPRQEEDRVSAALKHHPKPPGAKAPGASSFAAGTRRSLPQAEPAHRITSGTARFESD